MVHAHSHTHLGPRGHLALLRLLAASYPWWPQIPGEKDLGIAWERQGTD